MKYIDPYPKKIKNFTMLTQLYILKIKIELNASVNEFL